MLLAWGSETIETWGIYLNGEVRFWGKVRFSLLIVFLSPTGKSWMSPSYSIFEKCGGRTPVRSLFKCLAAPVSYHSCRPGPPETSSRHRQKKVMAGDGTYFWVCPGHEQLQAAEGSFHQWSMADWEQRGEAENSCLLIFCSVQTDGSSVVALNTARIFTLSGCRDEKGTIKKVGGEDALCDISISVSCEDGHYQ